VSLILFAIDTTGLIKCVEERVHAEGHILIDNLGWIATGKDVSQVVRKIEACAAEWIKTDSRRDLKFNIAQTEVGHLICRRSHKKHLQQKYRAKMKLGDCFVQFSKDGTLWVGGWMDADLMFNEHHNSCMIKTRTAKPGLHRQTRMHRYHLRAGNGHSD